MRLLQPAYLAHAPVTLRKRPTLFLVAFQQIAIGHNLALHHARLGEPNRDGDALGFNNCYNFGRRAGWIVSAACDGKGQQDGCQLIGH